MPRRGSRAYTDQPSGNALHAKAGQILWIPTRNELAIDLGIDDGCRGHPCVILAKGHGKNERVQVLLITSLRGRTLQDPKHSLQFRKRLVPITPCAPHPDNGRLWELKHGQHLKKQSYVKIHSVLDVELRHLTVYINREHGGSFVFTERSLHEMGELTGFTAKLNDTYAGGQLLIEAMKMEPSRRMDEAQAIIDRTLPGVPNRQSTMTPVRESSVLRPVLSPPFQEVFTPPAPREPWQIEFERRMHSTYIGGSSRERVAQTSRITQGPIYNPAPLRSYNTMNPIATQPRHSYLPPAKLVQSELPLFYARNRSDRSATASNSRDPDKLPTWALILSIVFSLGILGGMGYGGYLLARWVMATIRWLMNGGTESAAQMQQSATYIARQITQPGNHAWAEASKAPRRLWMPCKEALGSCGARVLRSTLEKSGKDLSKQVLQSGSDAFNEFTTKLGSLAASGKERLTAGVGSLSEAVRQRLG